MVSLPDSVTPLPGVIVVAKNARGAAMRALTGTRGEFAVRVSSPGQYNLEVLRIGFRPTRGPSVTVGVDDVEGIHIVFSAQPVNLAAIDVRDRSTCRVAADTGLIVTRVWEEARKAMLTTQLNTSETPLFAEWIEYDRTLDSTARLVREQRVHTTRNPTTHAFRSRPAEVLDSTGYVVADSSGITYYAPDAAVLLSDSFAAGHCFRLEASGGPESGVIGIAFQPARERRDVRDIEGTLWLDRASAELRRLEFRYTNLPEVTRSAGAGGIVEFVRLADGNWIISRWSARMPRLGPPSRTSDNGLRRVAMTATNAIVRSIQATGGEVVRVSRRDSLLYEQPGPHIALRVTTMDPLMKPSGAVVTLDGSDYHAIADSLGRVVISPVLAGRYRARVTTPFMDSLGMSAVQRDVEARTDARVDSLRLPSPREVLAKACPRDSIMHGEGMLYGGARYGQAMVVMQATVVVTWKSDISVIGASDADHLRYSETTLGTLTDDAGRWRICGVPRDKLLAVRIIADSGSDARAIQLADDRPFAAVDFVVHQDVSRSAREVSGAAGLGRRPAAFVELAVIDAHGVPVSDATLDVVPSTGPTRTVVTGPSGRALLPEVTPGRLAVRVRRIGFKEGQVAALVEAGRNTIPIVMSEIALPTLDTVRVVGDRRISGLGRLDDFETRRLNHQATVSITREDIVKRNPVSLWQMLTGIPSVNVVNLDTVVIAVSTRTMVTSFQKPTSCVMAIMIDGIIKNYDPSHAGFDLRLLPAPEEVHGLEVFAGASSIPVQYGGTGDGKWCGMIAVWTR
jgi:carboxypeptidase family protein